MDDTFAMDVDVGDEYWDSVGGDWQPTPLVSGGIQWAQVNFEGNLQSQATLRQWSIIPCLGFLQIRIFILPE